MHLEQFGTGTSPSKPFEFSDSCPGIGCAGYSCGLFDAMLGFSPLAFGGAWFLGQFRGRSIIEDDLFM